MCDGDGKPNLSTRPTATVPGMSDYTPISCADHTLYELWIMHRQTLRVTWRIPGKGQHRAHLRPLDLVTREGQEFLVAETPDGVTLELRLDYLVSASVA